MQFSVCRREKSLALLGMTLLLGVSELAVAQRTQQVCLPETDPVSPRRSQLKSEKPDPAEILRTDLNKDGTPDLIETWWNGKRVRWIGEGGTMKWTDVRGSMTNDALQIDRDGDGYYDGPGDINVKWIDDDNDGRPDVQVFAGNHDLAQNRNVSGSAIYMVFVDDDKDGVLGYIDWNTFEFNRACWRVPPATKPSRPQVTPNFSPDYDGDSTFLKQHQAAWLIGDIRYTWENPFLFFDTDGDGVTEMSIRILDTTEREAGSGEDRPLSRYRQKANEAYVAWDLDNSATVNNEMDYDMTLRFSSAPDGTRGDRLDYSQYHHKHPGLVAPKWVLDAGLFRYDNWRKIDEFIYLPHDKAYEEMFKPNWGACWLVFDEDNDDHRWERVELYYPTTQPYSTARFKRGHEGGGLPGHPQSDTLGDRGEWDADNSGRGQVYVGRFDHKFHLVGAEKGAWSVDYGAKFWGSSPVVGDSSPERAKKVEELVQYEDTNNNGYFDRIIYDYDGDQKPDCTINLLDYGSDVVEPINPHSLKWQGMRDAFRALARDSFQQSSRLYRALWKKGLTDNQLDDLAIASSTYEQYDHGYWLGMKIFRLLDQKLSGDAQKELRRAFFSADYNAVIKLIDALDPLPQKK